jgi:transketolase
MSVVTVDGHSVASLRKTLSAIEIRPEGKPLFVIAETTKGKGVSFMEHPTQWHGAAPNREQLEKALSEILGVPVDGSGDSARVKSPFGRICP